MIKYRAVLNTPEDGKVFKDADGEYKVKAQEQDLGNNLQTILDWGKAKLAGKGDGYSVTVTKSMDVHVTTLYPEVEKPDRSR